MKFFYPFKLLFFLFVAGILACLSLAYAQNPSPQPPSAQSTIVEAEGRAAMGEDKSRKATQEIALKEAKRTAAESAATFIKSETTVKNHEEEKDLIEAFSNGLVKVLQVMEKGWQTDPSLGECYVIKIRAEVIPDATSIEKIKVARPDFAEDPSAPLAVRIWTDKKDYRPGDRLKVYFKGNKPFYARIVYVDVAGTLTQILPNPSRSENYFNGGVVYEIPSDQDRFSMEVTPPFGAEKVLLYASSAQLGDIGLVNRGGGIFSVTEKNLEAVGIGSRGIKITSGKTSPSTAAAEFSEAQAEVRTGK